MFKPVLKQIAAAAALGLVSASASAVVVSTLPAGTSRTNEGLVSSVTGLACPLISFNQAGSLTTPQNPNDQCSGVTYTPSSGIAYVSGSVSGQHRAPPNDTSVYLTVSPTQQGKSGETPVIISLPENANYFGFYAGSLDSYNKIEFLLGDTVVRALTGTELARLAGFPNATGQNEVGGYFNVFLSKDLEFFNRVRLTSTAYAFETDNHAFGVANADNFVPAPGALALLGIGALGMFGAGRRRAV